MSRMSRVLQAGVQFVVQRPRLGNAVRLEACARCQLHCPLCSTGNGLNRHGVIGSGYLRSTDFETFTARNPSIRIVELSNYGEVFLNPELEEILRRAQVSDVALSAGNGVNLNDASTRVLDAVVRYGLYYLSVSIDGATNQTYCQYRRGGDLDAVIANVRYINSIKKKYGSRYPIMRWQYVVFGHNEHEILRAREMAASLGMDFRTRLSWNETYSPIRNIEQVVRDAGATLKTNPNPNRQREVDQPLRHICSQLWHSPQVNWDGELLGCCANRWESYGNVFRLGLDQCLRSQRYTNTKLALLGRIAPRADFPCLRCSQWPGIVWKPLRPTEIVKSSSHVFRPTMLHSARRRRRYPNDLRCDSASRA